MAFLMLVFPLFVFVLILPWKARVVPWRAPVNIFFTSVYLAFRWDAPSVLDPPFGWQGYVMPTALAIFALCFGVAELGAYLVLNNMKKMENNPPLIS